MSITQRIEVRHGDITAMAVDAVVNAANTSLLGGGGVDGAIHRRAGPALLDACRAIGGCPTGKARITSGYNLPARYVIHTVGPVYRQRPEDAVLLARCYAASLKLATAHGLSTVAFPAVSCGAYGYPMDQACNIALKTTLSYLEENPDIHKVFFVLFSKADAEVYETHLSALKR